MNHKYSKWVIGKGCSERLKYWNTRLAIGYRGKWTWKLRERVGWVKDWSPYGIDAESNVLRSSPPSVCGIPYGLQSSTHLTLSFSQFSCSFPPVANISIFHHTPFQLPILSIYGSLFTVVMFSFIPLKKIFGSKRMAFIKHLKLLQLSEELSLLLYRHSNESIWQCTVY